MNVTVTDATNRYITDLTEKDFEIFEDGVKQELTLFNRTNLPVALSLLIDTSSSMEDRMSTAQDAAIGFVRKLRPTDMGEVIGFDSRAEVLQKFTNNPAELEQAIRKTVAGGSTSLNNALYISLKGLKKIPVRQEEEIRRQAIVLLSDGEDTSSLVSFDDVLDLARRSETAIYAIGLMEDGSGTQSKGFREATYALAPVDDRYRRPGVLPRRHQEPGLGLRADLRRALEPVHNRLYLEESPARRRLAASRGSSGPAERAGTHQAGILRAVSFGSTPAGYKSGSGV